jgi:hypothetical protein
MQKKSMETIGKAWNAETAAQRLMVFCRAWMEGQDLPEYTSGPMSKAE